VIYAAKSTEDKRGSIPDQLRECREAIDADCAGAQRLPGGLARPAIWREMLWLVHVSHPELSAECR
jgi:hypothetical protein